jgi:hypothetical protein
VISGQCPISVPIFHQFGTRFPLHTLGAFSNTSHGIQGRFVSGWPQMVRNSIQSTRETETQPRGRELNCSANRRTNLASLGVRGGKSAVDRRRLPLPYTLSTPTESKRRCSAFHRAELSIFGWLLVNVIDDQHRQRTLSLLEFQSELLVDGVEKGIDDGRLVRDCRVGCVTAINWAGGCAGAARRSAGRCEAGRGEGWF